MKLRKKDCEELQINIKNIVPTIEELEILQNKLKDKKDLSFNDCILLDKVRIWNILLHNNNIKF